MKSFKELIENKRVVFVGSCPNLLGTGQGELINSFDTVIRANGHHMVLDEYKEDYGDRSDIIYFNVQHAREMRPLPVNKYVEDGVQYLCFKSLSSKDHLSYQPYLPCRDIQNIIKEVHTKVHGALMGLFIFEDILKFNPKQLYVTGIDFFKSKKQVFEIDNYKEYLDGYLPEKIVNQGNKINLGKTKDGHNQLANTRYIFDLWNNGMIDMPDFIRDIMLEIVNG